MLERLLRGQTGDPDLMRVLVTEFVEGETAAAGDLHCAFDGIGMAGEKTAHFLRWFEVTVAGLVPVVADLVDGPALTDAGQHIRQNVAAMGVIQHIAGGDGWDMRRPREFGLMMQADGVVRTSSYRQGQICAIAEIGLQALQGFRRRRRAENGDHAFTGGREIVPCQIAAALSAQPSRASEAGKGEHKRADLLDRRAPTGHRSGRDGADDQADVGFPGALMGTDDAGQRASVSDAKGRKAEHGGAGEQFLHMRGARRKEKFVGVWSSAYTGYDYHGLFPCG